MHKLIFIVIFLFFGNHYCGAQKIIQKEFYLEAIHKLSIIDDGIYKIEIQSSEESTIKIELHISGEHSESVIIEEKIIKGILSLKTGFAPFFKLKNDKLAAHKVMAIEMKLIIPETIFVEIKSKLASVEIKGKINALAVVLENGNCSLSNFLGNAHLKTKAGNITVHAQNNVSGIATSKSGTVENSLPKERKFQVEAESINGDIYLLQTE